MSQTRFEADVIDAFPEAVLSVDDGESLRFRYDGIVCGARFLSTGNWGLEAVDLQGGTDYEAAQFDSHLCRSRSTADRASVVPLFRDIVNQLLESRKK